MAACLISHKRCSTQASSLFTFGPTAPSSTIPLCLRPSHRARVHPLRYPLFLSLCPGNASGKAANLPCCAAVGTQPAFQAFFAIITTCFPFSFCLQRFNFLRPQFATPFLPPRGSNNQRQEPAPPRPVCLRACPRDADASTAFLLTKKKDYPI